MAKLTLALNAWTGIPGASKSTVVEVDPGIIRNKDERRGPDPVPVREWLGEEEHQPLYKGEFWILPSGGAWQGGLLRRGEFVVRLDVVSGPTCWARGGVPSPDVDGYIIHEVVCREGAPHDLPLRVAQLVEAKMPERTQRSLIVALRGISARYRDPDTAAAAAVGGFPLRVRGGEIVLLTHRGGRYVTTLSRFDWPGKLKALLQVEGAYEAAIRLLEHGS